MSNQQTYMEFGFENLECRKMMAGDVGIDVSGSGRLEIEGDNLANEISVTQVLGTNTIRVTGLNDTSITFDGQTADSMEIDRELWNDVVIDMGDGDDAVLVLNMDLNAKRGSDLKIEMGEGADRLLIQNVEFRRSINVDMGSNGENDIDQVHLNGVRANRDIDLVTGGGDDLTTVTNATSQRRTRIRMEDGEDRLFITNADTDNLRVELGDGDDYLKIRATAADQVRLDGGDDVDTIEVENHGYYANEFDAFAESDEFEVFVA